MSLQKTIINETSFSGVGLHTGNNVKVRLIPADIDTGIIFIRADLSGRPEIKACVGNLAPAGRTPRRSTVEKDGVQVQTVEHFMSALSGAGVNNLFVELDNNELPGLDGSGLSFLEIIKKAGVKEQNKEKEYFSLKESISIEEEGASIVAMPSSDFKISYNLDYNLLAKKKEFIELIFSSPVVFENEIAPARTFCLEREAKELRARGLGLGANYENTLVLSDDGKIINNSARFDDELVRHKILDLIGDLYLLGFNLKAHIIASKSGHSLNLKLINAISNQREKYSMKKEDTVLEVTDIMKILPHREPFLFVDRIVKLEYGKHATGIKNVTINDYFFKGHFPGRPVMPGVIMVEAMAQVGGVMMLALEENRGKLAFFMTINNIKFRKVVVPGDQLVLDVEAGKMKSRTGQVHGKAMVDGKVVAEADLMFAIIDS